MKIIGKVGKFYGVRTAEKKLIRSSGESKINLLDSTLNDGKNEFWKDKRAERSSLT